jgi:hypothetical protein
VPQHYLRHVLSVEVLAADKNTGKNPIHHRGFPFQDGFFPKYQGKGAEQNHCGQKKEMGSAQLAVHKKNRAIDNNRGGNQNFSGAENSTKCVIETAKGNDPFFHFVNDEEGNQRDVVNQLFHSWNLAWVKYRARIKSALYPDWKYLLDSCDSMIVLPVF